MTGLDQFSGGGKADSEYNNRFHRKIMVIDGKIGYTEGINLADEYINEISVYGHWKDCALRLEGEAVRELTRLFIIDWGMDTKKYVKIREDYYPVVNSKGEGYVIAFGDAPKPLRKTRVCQELLKTMFSSPLSYMYMTSPYLILDNDMLQSLENAALRGVDVRIIVPNIPDKKIIKFMGYSYYLRLLSSGVKIYEYTPGFIHAKTFISDDKYAMVGTINLDYRSLVHHFENGVWMYGIESKSTLKKDYLETVEKSREIKNEEVENASWYIKPPQAALRFLAPLM